jgi:RNA polymerase sigma factor for flagellar operon FliA
MSPKKSASAAKKSEPAETSPESRLRLLGEVKKSRVEPLPSTPQRRGLSGAGEPGETTTEEIWSRYHKARKAKKSEEIEQLRNLLMERHQPLVRYIAERQLQTLPKSIDIDDLISWGNFGLMDAIRGFEPERNIKFKTYCTMRIRGSILDHLRSQDWVPRLVRLKASRIERAYQKLMGDYGREPTHAELASELQMEHDELAVEISSANAKAMFSLSEKWEDREDDSSVEKVDVLEDRRAIDPIGELNKRDMMHFLTRSLTHKERFIIEQYYQVGHTMREIGEMLALTESRVCQIHSNVMGRLKGLLGQKSGTLLT